MFLLLPYWALVGISVKYQPSGRTKIQEELGRTPRYLGRSAQDEQAYQGR
jgi:hypothetical protein